MGGTGAMFPSADSGITRIGGVSGGGGGGNALDGIDCDKADVDGN